MTGIVELIKPQQILATDNDQHLLMRKPKNFIRGEELTLSLPLCFPVLGNHLCDGYGFLHGHGGIHNDAHFSAAVRYVIRSDIIRTTEHKLDVAVADDFGPKIVGIAVLKLAKALDSKHDPNIPGADDAQRSTEIRAVRRATDSADVVELVQNQIHGYRTPSAGGKIGKAGKLDKQE